MAKQPLFAQTHQNVSERTDSKLLNPSIHGYRRRYLGNRASHLLISSSHSTCPQISPNFPAPGVIQPGSVCQQPVGMLDLFPTLSEICELPEVDGLSGQSIVALLTDPNCVWDRPALTSHGRGNHALRSRRWRYIRYADGGEELYDHANDPNEWTNLASRSEFAEIKTELARWLPKTDAKPKRREKK